MALPLLSTDITVEISCITTVLPLESTVLPVVIPPNFMADFHWYTTGNITGKSRDIFYGVIGIINTFRCKIDEKAFMKTSVPGTLI